MSEVVNYVVDKTGWGDGPWMTEPDREQWTHAGYACLILRHPEHGCWCGYVGVHAAHPAYGKNPLKQKVEAEAHGMLNYGAKCNGLICHVPAPGMPSDVWWLGFDCGHAWDLCPGTQAFLRSLGIPEPRLSAECPWFRETYRDLAYVRRATEALAEQLRALVTPKSVAIERMKAEVKDDSAHSNYDRGHFRHNRS